MAPGANVLPGTLELLILKAASLGPLHGYGILLRIRQLSRGGFEIEQGAVYPALYRLIHQGLLKSEWGTSDNNRKARYYTLTVAGRGRLRTETAGWERMVATMTAVLSARPGEA